MNEQFLLPPSSSAVTKSSSWLDIVTGCGDVDQSVQSIAKRLSSASNQQQQQQHVVVLPVISIRRSASLPNICSNKNNHSEISSDEDAVMKRFSNYELASGVEWQSNGASTQVAGTSDKNNNNNNDELDAEEIRQVAAMVRSFRHFFDDADDMFPFPGAHFSRLFMRIHTCCPRDDSPLVGLLNEHALALTPSACCLLKSILVDLPQFDSLDPTTSNQNMFTAYGRRLCSMAELRETTLLSFLSEAWCQNFDRNFEQRLGFSLEIKFSETDDDKVEWCFGECSVCLANCRFVRRPPCCRKSICQVCWQSYVRATAANSIALQVTGVYNLHCYSCSKLVPYSQALACTERDDLDLIRPKNAANSSAHCPVCLETVPALIANSEMPTDPKKQAAILKKLRQRKGGHRHSCSRCGHVFCRFCGTDDHPKLSCQEVVDSDVGFQYWARQKMVAKPKFMNGRRCPNCKIPVAHNGGCPHMTCPCGAEFCYFCGRKYIRPLLPLQAFHTTSKMLPLITCPKLWESQAQRRIVHSLIGFGIIAGLVPLIIGLTPIVLPVVFSLKAIDRCRRRRR